MPSRKHLVFIVCLGVLLAGCGRKEPPQVVDSRDPPAIVLLEHQIVGNSLQLRIRLQGGSGGVGYQVDRAEMDPHCKCPGFWRRYYEQPPIPSQAGKILSQLISLGSGNVEYVFRIRAVDGTGRLGPWSKQIRAKAEATPE